METQLNNEQLFQFTEQQKLITNKIKVTICEWFDESEGQNSVEQNEKLLFQQVGTNYSLALIILYRQMKLVFAGKIKKGNLTIELIGNLAGFGHSGKVVSICQQRHTDLMRSNQGYREDFAILTFPIRPYIRNDKDLYSIKNLDRVIDFDEKKDSKGDYISLFARM